MFKSVAMSQLVLHEEWSVFCFKFVPKYIFICFINLIFWISIWFTVVFVRWEGVNVKETVCYW